MTESNFTTDRLNAIIYLRNKNGWVSNLDHCWLRNQFSKKGNADQVLQQAIKQHQVDLVTERLTRGSNNQTVQTPTVFFKAF